MIKILDLEQAQRMDIDDIANDKISLAIDDFNNLTSPLEVDLLNYAADGFNWVIANEQYIKYNLTENDKLVFNVDKISELSHKNITNIKVEFDIVEGNNNFIFNGINLIHDDVIKTKLFNVFMDDNSFSFNCGLFNYDDIDFVVSSKGFQLELLFNGNKINSLLVLENVKMIFSFTDKLQGEKDTIYNRIETDIDAKQDKLVSGVNIKSINYRSLLGSGNINIETSSVDVDDELDSTSTNPVQNKVITNALDGKANSSHEHTTSDITDFPVLSDVATSGSYDDLTDKPSIPTKTSDLTNDGDGTNVFVKDNDARLSDARTPLSHNHDDRYYTENETDTLLSIKQDNLVSGTNIKTINNQSILGSGDISIGGGGSVTVDDQLDNTSTNPVENRVITNALDGKSDTNHNHNYNDLTNKPNVINYQLTSNSYNPDINGTFTLTLKVTDIYGDPISNHNAGTLKENGYNVYDTSGNQIGASMITDTNGECSVVIPCYNLHSELYLQNNNSEGMLWSLRDYTVGDSHCQVQAEGWYYYYNESTYKLSRNGYLARFSLHGWSTSTVLTTTSWTNFGGSTAYAANIVPSSYVIMLNSGCNTYFRINTNGTIVCRAVSSNVAGNTNQYGTVTWSCDK